MNILLNGNLQGVTSFSIVNRQLIRGLRDRGHTVTGFAIDKAPETRANHSSPASPAPPALPDAYLAHGHPWHTDAAPGRLNVFALNYEYLTADRELRALIAGLNARFDRVLIPAPFLRPVLSAAGLRVPITYVPWGFDPDEFTPDATPIRLPGCQQFVFLHAASANTRKGTDLLVNAYRAEFAPDEPVLLVVKEAERHPTWARWAERVERRAARSGGPDIRWIRDPVASLAPYFAAADVGVFPHRGEGFGLPILECLASGRRVIASDSTGSQSFCTPRNAWLIRTHRVRRHGRVECEPDLLHLRQLLRLAYEQGRPARSEGALVARTVAGWTWTRTVARLDGVLRDMASLQTARVRSPTRATNASRPKIAYAFHSSGATSWKKLSREIDRSLRARFARYHAFTALDRVPRDQFDVIVGQSEHCLESILAVRRRNPRAIAVVHQETTVLGDRVAIVNEERAHCGLPPLYKSAMHLWRNRKENDLADAFMVASTVARGHFVANSFDPARVHIVPYGIRRGSLHVRRGTTTRFLFVGTDPFRKGIRHLFAAWEQAAVPNAELICHVDLEVLESKLLLGYLVRNPSITVLPLLTHAAFLKRYHDVDCQVLPSLEDTFSISIADGMGIGKPAIVSDQTGVSDLIAHGKNGHVVPAGDVEALTTSLRYFVADRRRLHAMGSAAHATTREYSWQRCRTAIGDLVQAIWDTRR